jgi:hypothetical protein
MLAICPVPSRRCREQRRSKSSIASSPRRNRSDPFHAVTVLTPSAKVAIHVARAITARRSAGDASTGRAGLVNVNFVTLARLAEELGTPALGERSLRRLTRTALTAAVRSELSSRSGLFGEATMHPATAAEVADRYGELRFAGTLEESPSSGVLFGLVERRFPRCSRLPASRRLSRPSPPRGAGLLRRRRSLRVRRCVPR